MPFELTENNCDKYITGKNVLIDFSSTWCGPCKKMKPELEQAESFVNSLPIDLCFAIADVDQTEELAEQYGISHMPTLILLKKGEEVARIKGYQTCENILMMIGKYFDLPHNLKNKKTEIEKPVQHVAIQH